MAILLGILAAADMYLEVTNVGSLHNELVEVSFGLDPVKPAVEDVFVCMGFAISPLGVRGIGYLDVGSFAYRVLG